MIAHDSNKRHKGKEVKEAQSLRFFKNSTRILEVGDNLKELK